TDPADSGRGEDDGVEATVTDVGDAGVDVSAHSPDLDIGAGGLQLHGAPGRTGADGRSGRQLGQAQAVAADEHVGGVDARWDRRHLDAHLGGGRQVLERMDGEVDLALVQRLSHRGDEDAGAAESGQRGHVDVPLGDDLDDLDPPT